MMKLIKQKKTDSEKKQVQEPHTKIRTYSTFSRACDHSPSHRETPAAAADIGSSLLQAEEHPTGYPLPAEAESFRDRNSTGISDPIELQDTLWSEDKYTIRFVTDNNRLLYRCELSYGERPVYSGPVPVRPDDEEYTWSFTGWIPEIVPVTKDATYTASFAAEKKGSGSEPESRTVPEPVREYEYMQEERPAAKSSDGFRPDPGYDTEYGQEEEAGDEHIFDYGFESDPSLVSGYDDDSVPVPEQEYPVYESEKDDESEIYDPDPAGSAAPEHEYDLFASYGSEEDTGTVPDSGAVSPAGEQPASFRCLFPELTATGKTILEASWQPLDGADGYDVFFAPCGKDFGDVYQTFPPEDTSCTFSRLEKKAIYKMRIQAFVLRNGEKEYIGKSYTLRCLTGGSDGKHTNASEIRVRSGHLDLLPGEKRKISATVTGQHSEKQILARGGTLRYLSDDPKIALVSKEGKVTAVSAGSCRIFLIALDGVHASLDVSVGNASAPVTFRKKKYALKVGKTINLKKKLKSSPGRKPSSLKWKSSDKEIAEVSKKGVVTALKKGRSTVRVKSPDGTRAKVRIRVNSGKKADIFPWESLSLGKGKKL